MARSHKGKKLEDILPALTREQIDPDNYEQSGNHPLFHSWAMANRRCSDPRHHRYKQYGARGIRFCRDWAFDFNAFARYVCDHVGPRPAGYSLDRIDNDGDYCPGNIRWASQTEQIRNRSNTRWIEYGGERMTVTEFYGLVQARIGVMAGTTKERMRRGMSPEDAMTTACEGRGKSMRVGALAR